MVDDGYYESDDFRRAEEAWERSAGLEYEDWHERQSAPDEEDESNDDEEDE